MYYVCVCNSIISILPRPVSGDGARSSRSGPGRLLREGAVLYVAQYIKVIIVFVVIDHDEHNARCYDIIPEIKL